MRKLPATVAAGLTIGLLIGVAAVVATPADAGAQATLAAGINDRGQIVIPDLGTGLTPITSTQPVPQEASAAR